MQLDPVERGERSEPSRFPCNCLFLGSAYYGSPPDCFLFGGGSDYSVLVRLAPRRSFGCSIRQAKKRGLSFGITLSMLTPDE